MWVERVDSQLTTDDIVNSIRRAYEYTFHTIPEAQKFALSVTPTTRLAPILPPDDAPCGGFVTMYQSLCDYYHTPVHPQLCWDVENLYQHSRELNLSKFSEEQEQPLDLSPVFHALRHNRYFTALSLYGCRMDKKEWLAGLAELLRHNLWLQSLQMSAMQVTREAVAPLAEALAQNVATQRHTPPALHTLEWSHVSLDDRGVSSVADFIRRARPPLTTLDLSSVGASGKAFAGLLDALHEVQPPLQVLRLGHNRLGAEGGAAMARWLSGPGAAALVELQLANSNVSWRTLVENLPPGWPTTLRRVDLSQVKLRGDDVVALAAWLRSVPQVAVLSLGGTSLLPEDLSTLLRAGHADADLAIDVTHNQLTCSAAKVLAPIAYQLSHLSVLDLSDNDLGDEGIAELASGLRNNASITRLSLNRNIRAGKAKKTAINALIKLISSECAIKALYISAKPHHPLKQDLIPFISALGANGSITELDISGHQMGNAGAVALAKSLQVNSTLNTLFWDENQTGLIG